MTRSRNIVVRLVGALLIIVALWMFCTQVILGMPGYLNFLLFYKTYNSIVATAKRLDIPNGSQRDLTIGGAEVSINRETSGAYVVTIITRNWNHAGIFGYIYTDDVLNSIASDFPGEETLPTSQSIPLFVNGRISGHWWVGYDPTH